MSDNELDLVIRRYGLGETAKILTDLVHQNDRSGSLTELCVRLAMAYGIQAAQLHATQDQHGVSGFPIRRFRGDLGLDITK